MGTYMNCRRGALSHIVFSWVVIGYINTAHPTRAARPPSASFWKIPPLLCQQQR